MLWGVKNVIHSPFSSIYLHHFIQCNCNNEACSSAECRILIEILVQQAQVADFIGTICIRNSVQHPKASKLWIGNLFKFTSMMNISLTSVFRARHPPLIISCLPTYRNRSVMFILMVTPGVGGSWLLGTPSCYHHLTLSRSMSGVTALAGSTLTHVLTSLAPHRDWVSDVGAVLRAASCEGGGCEIRFRNYLQRCSSQQGANLVKEAFTAKFTCYSKASRMPNSIRMKRKPSSLEFGHFQSTSLILCSWPMVGARRELTWWW